MEFKTPIAAWVLSRVVSTFSSASFPLRGRIEVGGALQSTHNHLEHALDIRQHIVCSNISLRQNLDHAAKRHARCRTWTVPRVVRRQVQQLAASRKRQNRQYTSQQLLTTKFTTIKLPVPESLPEQSLGICQVLA
jgi:hypothetical protein